MIITCPSCATTHNLPGDDFASDGTIIKCASCNHSWLEARALEVVDSADVADLIQKDMATNHNHHDHIANLPAIATDPNTDYEAARIAKAVKLADEKRLEQVAKRRAKFRGWATLAACISAPFVFAAAFPETVVRALPGSIALYDQVGIEVNIPGFTIANVTHQYLMAGGTRVLAIRGQIINKSGTDKTVPPLRFALRDKSGSEVYNWILDGLSRRALKAGQATSFLTRVAEPPKLADDFQIRFALKGEIAKTASYENNSDQRAQN